MTDTAASPCPVTSPSRVTEPWTTRLGWRLLGGEDRAALTSLFHFVAAVRAVSDHPALSAERKEQALADLAAPFSGDGVHARAEGQWALAAARLAGILAERAIEDRGPWQVLQAAGQDLRKTRYRDWSDLLMWCRFAAAPIAVMAFQLVGGTPEARPSAEKLGIALQLVDIVKRAPSHHAWLGRVYLPERWFTEAHCEIADLGFARISEPLQAVIARTLDQASALLDEGAGAVSGLAGFRRRMAFHATMIETWREIAVLRRQTAWATSSAQPHPRSSAARYMTTIRAGLAALRHW